jgi:voltage-gated potassium channel
VKLWLAVDKRHFFVHHPRDLAMVAVPILRPLRLARLLRLIRLSRVTLVLGEGLCRARILFAHHGLRFVLLAVTAIIFAAAGLELLFEQHTTGPTAIHNFGDAIWWAVVTVTTVG